MQKDTGRRLVDVLETGHQRHARSGERKVDLDVIGAVACESVDLVDNHEVDRVVFDVGEHALEREPLAAACTFTGIDELVDHDRAKNLGSSSAGFALGGNGEPFSFATATGLLFRRDA